jgi:hypothetical protein
MWEIKETSPNSELRHGHVATVVTGGTPVPTPLSPVSHTFVRGILIRAPGAGDPVPNVDTVWIGRKNVTPNSDAGTGGMPLPPGASIELPVEDPADVYVVSLSAGQDVAWMGV